VYDVPVPTNRAPQPNRFSPRPDFLPAIVETSECERHLRQLARPVYRRVIIADDHELVRLGLGQLLRRILRDARIEEASNGSALASALLSGLPADLLLVDLSMPGFAGEAAVGDLLERHPTLPVVVVSGSTEPACIARLLAAGVRGFLPKSLDGAQMTKAMELVLAGGRYLPPDLLACLPPSEPPRREGATPRVSVTPRQQDILELLLQGLPNKLIATRLDISEATVKMHVTAVLRHYDVRSRAGLLAKLR
jgi:DNA-binding NarL/FixJ family response regulator